MAEVAIVNNTPASQAQNRRAYTRALNDLFDAMIERVQHIRVREALTGLRSSVGHGIGFTAVFFMICALLARLCMIYPELKSCLPKAVNAMRIFMSVSCYSGDIDEACHIYPTTSHDEVRVINGVCTGGALDESNNLLLLCGTVNSIISAHRMFDWYHPTMALIAGMTAADGDVQLHGEPRQVELRVSELGKPLKMYETDEEKDIQQIDTAVTRSEKTGLCVMDRAEFIEFMTEQPWLFLVNLVRDEIRKCAR